MKKEIQLGVYLEVDEDLYTVKETGDDYVVLWQKGARLHSRISTRVEENEQYLERLEYASNHPIGIFGQCVALDHWEAILEYPVIGFLLHMYEQPSASLFMHPDHNRTSAGKVNYKLHLKTEEIYTFVRWAIDQGFEVDLDPVLPNDEYQWYFTHRENWQKYEDDSIDRDYSAFHGLGDLLYGSVAPKLDD